jgi:hypothetical protein
MMRTDLELLKGAIDIHVHSSPDLYQRISDHFEVARAAREVGFRALVIKSHNFPTAARAQMVQKEVRGIDVFGSLVLNLSMGGLNPVAVETAIKYGAKQIYMPTVDSTNHPSLTGGEIGQHGKGLVVQGGLSEYTKKHPRLRLVDAKGQLLPEVHEILRMIAATNIILNCGHVSYEEMERLVPAAQAAGARKVVVDHPYFTRLTIEQQEKLVAAGAVMNYTCGEILPRWWRVSVEDFAAGLRRLRPENVLVSSDCGQLHNPPVIEAMRLTIQLLLEEGFTAHEIRTMFHDNAARLLYE